MEQKDSSKQKEPKKEEPFTIRKSLKDGEFAQFLAEIHVDDLSEQNAAEIQKVFETYTLTNTLTKEYVSLGLELLSDEAGRSIASDPVRRTNVQGEVKLTIKDDITEKIAAGFKDIALESLAGSEEPPTLEDLKHTIDQYRENQQLIKEKKDLIEKLGGYQKLREIRNQFGDVKDKPKWYKGGSWFEKNRENKANRKILVEKYKLEEGKLEETLKTVTTIVQAHDVYNMFRLHIMNEFSPISDAIEDQREALRQELESIFAPNPDQLPMQSKPMNRASEIITLMEKSTIDTLAYDDIDLEKYKEQLKVEAQRILYTDLHATLKKMDKKSGNIDNILAIIKNSRKGFPKHAELSNDTLETVLRQVTNDLDNDIPRHGGKVLILKMLLQDNSYKI